MQSPEETAGPGRFLLQVLLCSLLSSFAKGGWAPQRGRGGNLPELICLGWVGAAKGEARQPP